MAGKVQDTPATEAASKAAAGPIGRFFGRFMVLKGAMPELWVIFGVKFVGILAYSIVNSTIVLWLSWDLGFQDQDAGYIVGIWTTSMTIFTILVGSLTDAIGIRKSLLLGIWICIVARVVMTFTTLPVFALAIGLLPLAIGEALGTPVLIAATRRYSTTAQRSISFSIIYVVMNLAFLVKGYIFDYIRHPEHGLGEHGHLILPLVGIELSTYRTLFSVSLGFELLLLPLVYFGIRQGAEATDEGVKIEPSKPRYAAPLCVSCGYNLTGNVSGVCPECGAGPTSEAVLKPWHPAIHAIVDTAKDTVRVFVELGRRPGFYRLLGFLVLIAFLKLLFVTMSYVFPKFGIRELGPGAPIGRLWDVTNAALIVVFVPIVGVLGQKISAYRMVTAGGIITAASMFIMVLPPHWFQPLADGFFGHLVGHRYLGLQGAVNPWYIMIFLYVVALSLGEAVYSPRVYEYAASIAPKGQEASYGALSYIPYFVAKLLVGTFSGVLLAKYCPEVGPRNPQVMWLILALGTLLAPVGLIVFRRWIRVTEAGRED